MTIMIVAFSPKEIMFVSDTFRYYLKEGTVEDVLNHKLEITHENLKDHIERYETNQPKIHKLTRNCGVCCGGDGQFSDITENLNKRKNITNQILERLKHKGKLNAFWSCHIGTFKKGKVDLTSIVYEKGNINVKESIQDNVSFDSFSLEPKDIFFKKYIYPFYLSNTEQKTKILQEFFSEITQLFSGLAGGNVIIAKIDKDGFQWIAKPKSTLSQNFTTYSLQWMPDKIETVSTTQTAWSSTEWTDILSLSFETESTALILLFSNCIFVGDGFLRLVLDGNVIPETQTYVQSCMWSAHSVAIVTKGTHTLKIQMRSNTGATVYGYGRRLTILKGFYQGGTT